MSRVLAFGSGALFGTGVCVSGMVRPSKVLGFLDFAGSWDATLLVVMASALAVSVLMWRVVARLRAPRFGTAFPGPPSRVIDLDLVGGAALFGIGWGIAGYCPGPAVVSLVSLEPGSFVFVAAVVAGMLLHAKVSAAERDTDH